MTLLGDPAHPLMPRGSKATSDVVLANREIAPDAILLVVDERTGGKPFNDIDEVISREERKQWQLRYKQVAGFSADSLTR